MASFMAPSRVKQSTFDHLVNELIQEGNSIEDASLEAIETLKDGGMDLDYIFDYSTKSEKDEKDRIEKAITTLEGVLQGKETWVNGQFSLQGLGKALSASTLSKGWRLVESRQLSHTLMQLLSVNEEEEDDDDDEDDGEDKDRDHLLKMTAIIDFLLFLLQQGATCCKVPDSLISFDLSTENNIIQILYKRLDKDIDEIEICQRLISLISLLLIKEENRDAWFAMGGAALLELACKMHKSNNQLRSMVDKIIGGR